MKLIEVGRDDVSGGQRVTAEIEDGSRVTWVQDGVEWRNAETGRTIGYFEHRDLEPLLWLHNREQRRKGEAGVTYLDHGRRVSDYPASEGPQPGLLHSIIDKLSEPRAKPTLPPELVVSDAGKAVAGAYSGAGGSCTAHTGGTLTQTKFLDAQQGVRSGEVTVGRAERYEVHLHKAVTVVLVEAPEPLEVHGSGAPPVTTCAGTPYVRIDPEASSEGLRLLRVAIGMALERRARGDE